MTTRQFEPMSVGGILDRTFTIYRENFVRFLVIAAVVYVPIGLIDAASNSVLVTGLNDSRDQVDVLTSTEFSPGMEMEMEFGEPGGGSGMMLAGLVGMGLTLLLSVVGTQLASAALLRSVSEYYLGKEVTVGEAYGYVLPKLVTLIGAGLLVGIVVMFGFVLLIVPGIIFSLWFTLTTPAIVVENMRATEGMSRSKGLASGNLGKIFSTLFVVAVISAIAGGVIGGIGGVLGGRMFGDSVGAEFVMQLFGILAQVVTAPIWAVAIVLLYYDLRIRKEGFDLEMMARDFEIPEAQPYAPASDREF